MPESAELRPSFFQKVAYQSDNFAERAFQIADTETAGESDMLNFLHELPAGYRIISIPVIFMGMAVMELGSLGVRATGEMAKLTASISRRIDSLSDPNPRQY